MARPLLPLFGAFWFSLWILLILFLIFLWNNLWSVWFLICFWDLGSNNILKKLNKTFYIVLTFYFVCSHKVWTLWTIWSTTITTETSTEPEIRRSHPPARCCTSKDVGWGRWVISSEAFPFTDTVIMINQQRGRESRNHRERGAQERGWRHITLLSTLLHNNITL